MEFIQEEVANQYIDGLVHNAAQEQTREQGDDTGGPRYDTQPGQQDKPDE